ncbi:putative transcriptional regulatory protein [Neolecta irregularis DAH-3]|uniref:Putative transcriptional regulatory protein n=1 Tax=Neolecta irregularis (strain DAH-3) TaxID=1198029 RepID=A0A1U7LHE8_NEOID|nr:putative transcriptional regulatory protein [Neolecta irregularis DAH-3]|eukprot:OLL21951.1 putative transcriptional regulatory protein [Neolecta irregularis DAH-3]
MSPAHDHFQHIERQQKKKRNRAAVSCVPCRNRKIKCSRQQPCESCTGRGHPDECIFKKTDSAAEVTRDDINIILLKRVENLEGLLRVIYKQNPPQSNFPPVPQQCFGDQPNTTTTETPTNDEPGNLEVTLGLLAVHEERSHYLGPTSAMAIFTEIESLKEVIKQSEKVSPSTCASDDYSEEKSPDDIANSMLLAPLFNQTKPDKSFLLLLIPPREDTDAIVQHFMQYLQPLFHLLHTPTFMQEYAHFWQNMDASFEWLSLFFSVMILGTHCLPERSPVFLSLSSREDLIERFYKATESALIMSKYLVKATMTTIQTLLLIFIANETRAAAKQNWALLGAVLRLSQQIGLHRDPSLFNLPLLESEMRRRTWASVLLFNRWCASRTGVLLDISETMSDTRLPMDLNDTDLISGIPICQSKSTDMSLLLARDRVSVKLHHLLSEAFAIKPPPYLRVLEMDDEIRAEVRTLPHCYLFKPASDQDQSSVVVLTKYEIEALCNGTILFIHRPYAVRSRTHPEYIPSRHRCHQAAQSLLKLFIDFETKIAIYENYRWFIETWYRVYHFHAALVVALSLVWYPNSPNATELRNDLYASLKMFNKPCFKCEWHRKGFAILLVLCQRGGVDFHLSEEDSPPSDSKTRDMPSLRTVAKSAEIAANADYLQHGSFSRGDPLQTDMIQGFDWQNWDTMMQSLDASLGVGFTDGMSSF